MGLDIVELVMTVETEFGVEIPNADAAELRTVGQLFDYVAARVDPRDQGTVGRYEGSLWDRYLDVVAKETGSDRTSLTPNAGFVDDLGLD
jgi:acyl carrier protein